jgi:hypothetical protein
MAGRVGDPHGGASATTEVSMSSVMQPAGIRRTDLQPHDLSVAGHEVIQNRVDIDPGVPAVRHRHPGEVE